MIPIPLYHLSPVGRAAISVESARIRSELAARRADRDSRQRLQRALDHMQEALLPFAADAGAMESPAEHNQVRP